VLPLLVGLLMSAVLATGGCASGNQSPKPANTPAIRVPLADVTPKVSADENDPAWVNAAVISEFGLALRSPPSDRPLPTQVRLLWDHDWLYIRFISTGPEPYSPYGKEHDARHYRGDAVEVFLDPVGDGKQYFEFQQSPVGGLLDQNTLLTTDARSDADGRLTPAVLQKDYWPNLGFDMPGVRNGVGIVRKDDQYTWVADFAFPAAGILKRTGKKNYEPMTLRLNLIRYHYTGPLEDANRKLIAMNWSPVVFGCPHQSPVAMGTIELVNVLPGDR
jgi:hypothetical protein